jgi:hypothetical protein
VQAAQYLDGFDGKFEQFCFIAQEKVPPYAAGIYWLDEASLELGRQQYRQALAGIAKCQREGTFPVGYGEQEISLPAWAFYQEEDNVEVSL